MNLSLLFSDAFAGVLWNEQGSQGRHSSGTRPTGTNVKPYCGEDVRTDDTTTAREMSLDIAPVPRTTSVFTEQHAPEAMTLQERT